MSQQLSQHRGEEWEPEVDKDGESILWEIKGQCLRAHWLGPDREEERGTGVMEESYKQRKGVRYKRNLGCFSKDHELGKEEE